MGGMQRMNRRDFLSGAAALSGSAALTLAAHPLLAATTPQAHLLLVGTQTGAAPGKSKGIYAYTFDSITGELSKTGLAAASDNPTFLVTAPDKRTLYAANELDSFEGKPGGSVTSFTLDPTSGHLTQVSQSAAHGASTCHVAVDHTGAAVFAANYNGGSAASFHVSDRDHLSPSVSFFQYAGHGPDKDRQTAPHAHRVTVSPDNRYLLVNDLGLDLIHIYQLDAATGRLTPNDTPSWQAPAGSGPRALLFHPNGKFAYCVCEMASKVIVLAWDAEAGTLTTKQEFPLPLQPHTGPSTGDDIVLDRHARFAYVTNRGDNNNFIATFAVSPDGSRLTFQRRSSCGGSIPRHLALDPSEHWLLVANQESDTIAVFARDPQSGILAETGKTFPLSKPQCLVFPLRSS